MKLRILPQEGLKLIACITMLIDHIGYMFFPRLIVLRLIGRMAFPIYCFLLTEGAYHTRDKKKYLLRLAVLTLLSEIPFDYAFYGTFHMAKQSVMITLLLGVGMILLMEKIPYWYLRPLLIVPFCVAAHFLRCDYSWRGILIIAVFYMTRDIPLKHLVQLLVLAVLNFRGSRIWILGIPIPVYLFAVTAMIPIALYSGKKLTRSMPAQLGFNLFYPTHMCLLYLIRRFL